MKPAAATDRDALLEWRREFPTVEATLHFISHSLGAMPRGVEESLRQYAQTRLSASFVVMRPVTAARFTMAALTDRADPRPAGIGHHPSSTGEAGGQTAHVRERQFARAQPS